MGFLAGKTNFADSSFHGSGRPPLPPADLRASATADLTAGKLSSTFGLKANHPPVTVYP